MEKRDFFFQNYLKLEEDVLEVARYIFFTDSQLTVYSPHIGDLVVRCAIEIEAIAKELYFDSDVENRKELGKNIYFDTDCLAYMDQNYKTSK
ncbi:MAG: hypothetical protein KHZ78_07920 [Peptoniphilus sp. oral taxon 375]|nr:hypothetical protein [Peptoniphilus sp. oral taxon 375]